MSSVLSLTFVIEPEMSVSGVVQVPKYIKEWIAVRDENMEYSK